MILDIDARMVNGQLCLFKYDHKKPDRFMPIIDRDAFVTNISIKDMHWQKINSYKEFEKIRLLPKYACLVAIKLVGKRNLLMKKIPSTITIDSQFYFEKNWQAVCLLSEVFGEDDE